MKRKTLFCLFLLTTLAVDADDDARTSVPLALRLNEHLESDDLDAFTSLNQTIHLTGRTLNFKGMHGYLIVEKIEYVELVEEDGQLINIQEHQHKIKGLAYLLELAKWPDEYVGQRVTVTGFLRANPPKQTSSEPIATKEKGPGLFTYYPGERYAISHTLGAMHRPITSKFQLFAVNISLLHQRPALAFCV